MTKLLLLLCVLASSTSAFAQVDKIKLAVTPFTYSSSSAGDGDAANLTESITNEFIQTNRFTILDRSSYSSIDQEKMLQRTEAFIDGEVVQLGKNIGAQYILTGHVIEASKYMHTYTALNGNKTQGWKASMTVQIKVIDIMTTEVLFSERLSGAGGSSFNRSQDGATNAAMKGVVKDVKKFIGQYFPIEILIHEIQSTNSKGEADKVLVYGGSEMGVVKGDVAEVKSFSSVMVNGNEIVRKKTIGKIKIVDVEDEYFSVGIVKDGGEDILNKFNAGEKLKCYTIK